MLDIKELNKILTELLALPENEVVEFKLASNNFDFRKLGKYFSALSNEANLRGKQYAWLVFGIDDKTHVIKGTSFRIRRTDLDSVKAEIASKTTNNISFIEIYELKFTEGRVIMFQIPACPKGIPVAFEGFHFGRNGEELSALNIEEIERIRRQHIADDWSIQTIPDATISDLDVLAIGSARNSFQAKHKNNPLYPNIEKWETEIFLDKAKITIGGKLTNTAVILLGTPESSKFLSPHVAEILWKLDTTDDKSYDHFGPPFILTTSHLLQKIRNPKIKLFPKNNLIPAEVSKYETRVILEALHNCIAHQDYLLNSRIIVTEKGDKLIFENAGGFFEGSPDDYVNGEKTPLRYRNEWLAKAMVNLGMIDTLGYGIHTMFQEQRKRFFPLPDYSKSTKHSVILEVYGHLIDERYTRTLMEKKDLSLSHVVCLDRLQKGLPITDDAIKELKRMKLIEGKKPYYIISEPIAHATEKVAQYLKNRGFDNKYYKKLIVEFITINKSANRKEIDDLLIEKLPDLLSNKQRGERISYLLKRLRSEGIIENKGSDAKPHWLIVN